MKNWLKTSQKLGSFRNMVKAMQGRREADSSREAEALIDSIVPSFENAMNNDLGVKAAFDCLYETVSKLYRCRNP